MRKFFTVFAKVLGSIFAMLFVITAILAVLLTTLSRQIFNASLYKNILTGQNIYSRFPEIVGVAITSSSLSGTCTQNILFCSIDNASPELQACLKNVLGADATQAIGSGQRNPTQAELQLAQPCLDQYDTNQTSASQFDIGDSGGGSGMPLFLQNLTAADWQSFLTMLLPSGDLKAMAESTIDQMVAYLNGETNTVTIPLGKLKERLSGTAGADLILKFINSQPGCTDNDLEQMMGLTGGGMTLVLCKPPEVLLTTLAPLFPDLLNTVVPQIPDQVMIIPPPKPGAPAPGSGAFGSDSITTLRTVRLVMRLSPLVPLALLLLVTLFAVRSLKSWLRWWGIPLFISGVMALAMAISFLPLFNMAWSTFVIPHIPAFIPADIAAVGLDLVRAIVRILTQGISLRAMILLVPGLAAWIGSNFIKTRHAADVSVPPVAPAF